MGTKTELYNDDCLNIMPKLHKVDMILCDLPYGTTRRNEWDIIIPFDKLWERYNNIIKDNGAIVLFSQPPFDKNLAVSNIDNFRYEWIWVKNASTGFLNANKAPLKATENILVFYKKQPIYNPQMRKGFSPYQTKIGSVSTNYNDFKKVTTESNGDRYPINCLFYDVERGLHPTQKPIHLLEYLIRTYTNEGETVLDNCMGSGSTGVACVNTNRGFIGIEKEKIYFDIAKKRIESVKMQMKMF